MSVVLSFDPATVDALRAALARAGFHFEERPHAHFLARREGVTLTAYASGKLLLTGPQAEEYAGVLRGQGHARAIAQAPAGPTSAADLVDGPHIGSDESGKGDYFGPLVVAAVHVDDATSRRLRTAGVRDSKTLDDAAIGPLASLVRATCPHRILALPPPKYNELYSEIRNVNTLLAWAHARVLEDLLTQTGDEPIVVDQFAKGALERRLMERGRRARLVLTPRAERDIAVAAASVLARSEFLASIQKLGHEVAHALPLGAGTNVDAAARALVTTHGPDVLPQVAKTHFANTTRILPGR